MRSMSFGGSMSKGLIDNLVAKSGAARPILEAGVAKIRAMSKGMRTFALLSTIAAVAIGGFFALHTAQANYAPLFTNLDRDDAAGVVTKLKELKIPFKVEGDGSIIEVPGQGLPRGGNVGFESFDKMRLGATEFEQRILYRRALEGELARTIGTIA